MLQPVELKIIWSKSTRRQRAYISLISKLQLFYCSSRNLEIASDFLFWHRVAGNDRCHLFYLFCPSLSTRSNQISSYSSVHLRYSCMSRQLPPWILWVSATSRLCQSEIPKPLLCRFNILLLECTKNVHNNKTKVPRKCFIVQRFRFFPWMLVREAAATVPAALAALRYNLWDSG